MHKLSELETLARAATPGEWEKRKWGGREWPEKRISVASGNTAIVISPRYAKEQQVENDAAYIAAANPATILALCEIIRAQQGALQRVFDSDIDESVPRLWDVAGDALAKAAKVMGGE